MPPLLQTECLDDGFWEKIYPFGGSKFCTAQEDSRGVGVAGLHPPPHSTPQHPCRFFFQSPSSFSFFRSSSLLSVPTSFLWVSLSNCVSFFIDCLFLSFVISLVLSFCRSLFISFSRSFFCYFCFAFFLSSCLHAFRYLFLSF